MDCTPLRACPLLSSRMPVFTNYLTVFDTSRSISFSSPDCTILSLLWTRVAPCLHPWRTHSMMSLSLADLPFEIHDEILVRGPITARFCLGSTCRRLFFSRYRIVLTWLDLGKAMGEEGNVDIFPFIFSVLKYTLKPLEALVKRACRHGHVSSPYRRGSKVKEDAQFRII